MQEELHILSPLGLLGYGVPEDSLNRARRDFPIDVIAVDSGSMDPGPNYLGEGKFFADENMVERDLELLLTAAEEEGVPFLTSTAGGAGSRVHLEKVMDIVRHVVTANDLSVTVGKIFTDVEKSLVREKLRSGEVRSLGSNVELDEADVDRTSRIVAQVGATPFVDTYERGADLVVGGRASDLSPFAAVPLSEGFDPGLTYHLSKLLECGARATTASSGNDCLVGVLGEDYFEVVPPNPDRRCTVESVAAHTLYEKSDPTTIKVPEGTVDIEEAKFEQVDDRRVRVTGSTFRPREAPNVLVEGVYKRGYRSITPAGVRDPQIIDRIEGLVERTHERVAEMADVPEDAYELTVRTYGAGAVSLMEDRIESEAPELGIIIDAVGDTQEIADTICGFARSSLLHLTFEGRVNTGGNLAFPFSPSDVSVGPVYNLSVYHLLEQVGPGEIPDVEFEQIGQQAGGA